MARGMKDTGYKPKILNYLLTGKKLTRFEAMQKGFGMDLTTRISELRQMNIGITDKPLEGKPLQKVYFMTEESISDYKSTKCKENSK